MPEMKTLICPGPPEHEFKIPKGRGRPPRYCEEHKSNGKSEETKVSETRKAPTPTTRKRPGSSDGQTRQGPPRRAPRVEAQEKGKLDEPVPGEDRATMTESGTIRKLPRPGTPDKGSRAKAEFAADHAVRQQPDTDQSWPRNSAGKPMAKIEFSASELIPTGQYANVSVGPGRITVFIDLDRDLEEGEGYLEPREKDVLVKATNELAEVIERDVIAVQRSIVLESLQEQLSSNGGS